ncbi:MAG: hypothetical protein JWM34_165 [Ilumatobacteraceae bacterium]|nr:hypothetical protein [Ilumatobacteraceae bacterium]
MTRIRWVLGVPEHTVSYRERLVATLVALAGLAAVAGVGHVVHFAGSAPATLYLVGSMGASAVLVFGVPHAPLSQPWPVIGGHLVSAVVGVIVAHLLGGGVGAAAVAVALAIGAMHTLRCVHPPGGATALSAVLLAAGGHTPTWHYVAAPVLLNAITIVVAAVVLNAAFPWRRYPLALAFARPSEASVPAPDALVFTTAELQAAFAELDTLIEVSDEELQELIRVLRRRRDNA